MNMKFNPKNTSKIIVSSVISLSCAFSAYHLYQNGLVFNPNALSNQSFKGNQVVFNHQQQTLDQNQNGNQDIYKNNNQSNDAMNNQDNQSGYLFQNATQPFKSNQNPNYLINSSGSQSTVGGTGSGSTILVPGENGTIIIPGDIANNGSSGNGSNNGQSNNGNDTTKKDDYVDKDTQYQLPDDPFSSIGVVSAFKPTTSTKGYTFNPNYESVMDMVDIVDPLYYGCVITPWKLLCNSVVYVLDGDTPVYRITELSDCFEIVDYPTIVTGDFTATFRFRENVNAPWQEAKHTFKIEYDTRVTLLNYDNQEAGHFYLKEGQSEDLRKYYNVMIDDQSSVSKLFSGWSNKKDSEPLAHQYSTNQKGRVELYPLELEDIPAGFEVELKRSGLLYHYVLTGIDGERTYDDISIPSSIDEICLEGNQTIDVNGDFYISSSINKVDFKTTTLNVNGQFKVDHRNEQYSSFDGLLMDKNQETIIYMPCHDEISIPESVKDIKEVYPCVWSLYFDGPLKIKDTSFLSQIQSMFTTINVKDKYYLDYYRYGYSNAHNVFLYGETLDFSDYEVKNDLILSDNDTKVVGTMAEASGTIIIPNTVTSIADNAFSDNDKISRLIFPYATPLKFGKEVFKDSHIKELLFLSNTIPHISSDTFDGLDQDAKIEVLQNQYEEYLKQWSKYQNQIIKSKSEFYEKNGFDIIKTSEDNQTVTTLLNAPSSLKEFNSQTLSDIEINEIGRNAFSNCSQLTYVELPASVNKIDAYAFYGCHSLEGIVSNTTDQIVVEEGGLEINGSNTGDLRFVVFNANVAQFENNYNPTCHLLMYVPQNNEGYPELVNVNFSDHYFCDYQGGGYILYGDWEGSTSAYYLYAATTTVHGHIATQENVIEILEGAFKDVPITQIDLHVYSLGYFIDAKAFENTKLSGTLELPDGLAKVFGGAFANTQIEKVIFPQEYSWIWSSSIDTDAFYGTDTLKEVVFNSDQIIDLWVNTPTLPFSFNSHISQENIKILLQNSAAGNEEIYIESWKYLFAGVPFGNELFFPDDMDKLNEAVSMLQIMFGYKPQTNQQPDNDQQVVPQVPVEESVPENQESSKPDENQETETNQNSQVENNEEESNEGEIE